METSGDGPPLVLVHAGVADSRMWGRLVPLLPDGRTIVTYDMRGFGRSPLAPGPFSHARDLIAILERFDEPATVVAASLGGRVALEVAGARPELTAELLLLAPATIGHDWSQAMRDYDEEETAAIEAGDVERAVQVNVDMWVRDPSIEELVADMQRRAFELQLAVPDDEEEPLGVHPERIQAKTTILIGELDIPDFAQIAATIPNAAVKTVEGAGHLIALERPDAVAAELRD